MEIFYCFRCGSRVRAADLQAGAVRFADRIACAPCAEDSGLAPLVVGPRAGGRESSPGFLEAVAPPSPMSPKRWLLWAGLGGLAALSMTVVSLALLRSSNP